MAKTKEVTDFDQLYPGRFIKSGDLEGRDITLTISHVHLEELEGTTKQMKGILTFKETPRQFVLNKTNGESIKAMFGRKVPEWVGKRVTFYAAKIESDLADVAIRVRGSPDLEHDITFTLNLARKRPRAMTMKKTVVGKAKPAPAPPPVEEEVPQNVEDAAEILGAELQ